MADLKDIASLLKVDIPVNKERDAAETTGQRRRAWLVKEVPEENALNQAASKGVYRPLILKFSNLRNNPLKLILFFFQVASEKEGFTTKRITQTEIQHLLNFSRDSARTALRFLLKNKLIWRANFKAGEGRLVTIYN